MKKILLLVLSLVLCLGMTFGLVACVENEGDNNETPAVSQDLQDAMDYIWSMYKDKSTETAASFDRTAVVAVAGVKYAVEWTVDNDAISIVEKDENTVTVVIPEEPSDTIEYKLTATIKDSEGNSISKTFEYTVPKFKITSLDEYLNSATGDTVVVEGYVVSLNSKSATNTRNHLFLVDESLKGGYYAYNLKDDPVELGIEIGMKVRITGSVEQYGKNDTFGGMPELKDSTVKIIDSNKAELSPVDITSAFISANDLRAYSGAVVTVKGVTIGGQKLGGSSDYLYFTLNGIESYVRSYLTDLPVGLKSEANKAAIEADHLAHFGYKADVTGVLIFYGSVPYIIPVSVTPFTNYQLPDRTDAEKIELELGAIEIVDKVTEKTTITLPLVGSTYDNVILSWVSDNACAVIEDGKLVITLPDEAATVKLTVSAKIGDGEAVTRDFEIKVSAKSNDLYIPKADSTPVADKAFKFGLYQVSLGKYLYITGIVDGRYLATSEVADEAIDVYAEVAEGGFKFYILVEGAKQYITVYNNESGKLSVKYDAAGTSVYAYNATVNAWVTNMDGTDYYLGTYSTFNTISASKLSYITAENTGVSQFPASLYTLAPAALDNVPSSTPVADKAFKFGLYQVSLGKYLYITGIVDGRYLATTEVADEAIDVYAEVAEGGFKFYILVEGAKQYITVYNNESGKLSVKYDAAGTSVYAYNATVNAWVTNMDGTDYYLGTYSTFNTISASKLSYITAENTGVSQFPASLYTLVLKEVAPVSKNEPAADTAYKFAINQVTLGGILYVTGEVDGRYLATTDKISEAADVYAEVAEGGFKFYILVEGAKQYITVYNNESGKLSVKYDAAGTSVFAYNATVNAWVTNMDGTDYYLGTYSTFNTISASKLSYITAENTGVSQFPASVVAIEFVTEGGDTPVDPPHEHTFVDGKCECGATDPDYKPETPDTPDTPVLGDVVAITIDKLGVASQNYAAGTVVVDGASFEFVQIGNYGDGIQMRDKDGKTSMLWNTVAFSKGIKEIQLVYSSTKDVTHSNADAVIFNFGNEMKGATYSTKLSTTSGVKTYTITPDADTYTFLYIEHDLGYTMYWESITIVFADGSSVTPPEGGDDITPPEGGDDDTTGDDTATLPADGSTLTAAQALALNAILASGGTSTEKYYISGIITGFYGSSALTYGNVYIKDAEGNTILIYGLVDADGKKYSEMATKPVIGDTITVHGVINNYSGTIQFKNATVTAHTAHECAMSEATCKAPATCSICGKTEGDVLDHVYVGGVCSGCGAAEPTGDQTTASVSIADYAAANSWANSTMYSSIVIDENITVTAKGGSNTGKYYTSGTNWRLYQSESPTLTITAAEGKTIVSVKITYASNNTGAITFNGTNVASGELVVVNANSVAFGVGNTGTASNGQARVTAIEVIYQ